MRSYFHSRFYSLIVIGLCLAIFIMGITIWHTRRIARSRVQTFYHFVEKGEKIQDIAQKYSLPVEDILLLNKPPNPDKLYQGQALLIPDRKGIDVNNVDLFSAFCNFPSSVTEMKWEYIIIHHSATSAGSALAIHEYHLKRNMWRNGLGYDFIIGNGNGAFDGGIEVSHRWAKQMHGSHVAVDDMNAKGIGICLIGNFENTLPTDKQLETLNSLTRYLSKKYNIPPENILGHGEVKGARTQCPGKHLKLEKLRKSL